MLKINLKLSKDIKKDNINVFCKKIDRSIKSLINHKLITVTVIDSKLNFCERIYSNNKKIYPILGQKNMPKNIWSKKVLKNKKHFLCKNKKDIKKIYYDYETIFSLGCGSIINLLVLFKGKPLGTINILHEEHYYNINDLKKIDFVTTFLIPYFLEHQKIMKQKTK